MNDDGKPGGPDAGTDTGRPVTVLGVLEEEPPPRGFFRRLRSKIDRQMVGKEVLSLTLDLPKLVLLEFLKFFFDLFQPDSKGGRGGPE